jgi:hypothetical protein
MSDSRLEIRLKPRAKNDRISVNGGGRIDITVTSPPIDERANRHCITLLAEYLGVPKSSLSIIRGEHSRNKVVAVAGLTKEEASRRLTAGIA